MRKTLLSTLLAAIGLLMGLNAHAECDLVDGAWYFIKNTGKNSYVNLDKSYCYGDNTTDSLQVVKNGDKWAIKNKSGKYLSYDSSTTWYCGARSSAFYWTIEKTDDYYTLYQNTLYKTGFFGGQSDKVKFYTMQEWESHADYCKFTFTLVKAAVTKCTVTYKLKGIDASVWKSETEVDKDADYPTPTISNPFITLDSSSFPTGTVTKDETIELDYTVKYSCFGDATSITQWYALDIHGNEGDYPVYAKTEDDIMYAYNNSDKSIVYRRVAEGTADDYQNGAVMNDFFAWGFIGNPFDGVKLYNKGKNAYVYFNGVPTDVTDRTQAPATFVATAAEASVFKPINTTATLGNAFCLQNGAAATAKNILNQKNHVVSGYNAADGGSAMRAWAINYTASENEISTTLGAEYGTLIVPFYAAIPEGIEVYSCASASDKGVLSLKAETAIYPNVPYIIKGTEGTIYNFTSATLGNYEGTTKKGLLTGTYSEINAEGVTSLANGNNYILKKQNGILGFYQLENNKEYKNLTIGANRCYLTLQDASVKAFYFDEETAISEINDNTSTSSVTAIYNIAGQRINKLQKGINIINGKKVLK